MIAVHANLDCEARWAGVQLPARVLRKVSALAALTSVLVDDDAEVWAPAAVDPTRILAAPAWRRPAMRVGTPEAPALAWADPGAKPFNDRRFAVQIAAAGVTVHGVRAITSVAELAAVTGAWVCKALWTTAGRDRCRGDGPPTPDQRVHLARMIDRSGAVMFEPWLDRVVDVGTCARVTATGVVVEAPHTLVVDPRGGFAGIELDPPPLAADERDQIVTAVEVVGRALSGAGYTGPFAIDSFVYLAGGERRVRPIVEINARHTFGHVARALGARRLGFTSPPSDATLLVAATTDDPTTAWIA